MAKYHSTISRRDFLKILGLGGVGLGAAAVSAPVFHDLDELMASPQAQWKRPFWVKEVDKPTVEIDWGMIPRWDPVHMMWGAGLREALGQKKFEWIFKLKAANEARWRNENKPGYTLRDFALGSCDYSPPVSFLGPRTSPTPESLGIPRWEGTPEENARMVRAFMRLHGAAQVGFVELDTNTEKLIYSHNPAFPDQTLQGPRLDILDVDEPVDAPADPAKGAGGYQVIPKKARWVIVYTLRMSHELMRRAPSKISSREHGYMYDLRCLLSNQLQNFLRTLGYMCLAGANRYACIGTCTGFAVMAGLGETCRISHTITPEHGLMQRVFLAVTDLPLAPGKPVDFGVMNFCRTCKKCADFCPARAIPHDTEPSWEIRGFYQTQGHRAWHRDEPRCLSYIWETGGACAICFAVCPYSKAYKAAYHDVVRTISSTTPVLNRFFRKMDDFLGYGLMSGEDIEKFWELDLPPFGWE